MRKVRFSVSADPGELVGYRAGAGAPVLLLHGGPGLSMDYLEGLVVELADHYEVAVFQQRGLPPSTGEGPFTIARAVADVAAILEGLGWERSLLLGHSWGGHLALHLAVSRPELLAAALALDPVGAADDGGLAAFSEALTARAAPEQRDRLEQLQAIPDDEATEGDHLELMGIVWPGYFAHPDSAPALPSIRACPAASAGLWAELVALMPTLAVELEATQLPMTLVGCTGSPIPVEAVRRTADLAPRAELEVFEGVGHLPWLEQPGLVVAAMDRLARRADVTS
jgi:pimeloyl-ACP methyl ester carboxylesterase